MQQTFLFFKNLGLSKSLGKTKIFRKILEKIIRENYYLAWKGY
jgi:hypothetical protein